MSVILTALLLVRLAGNSIKLVRSFARLWADRQVRRMCGAGYSFVMAGLDRIPVRERRVGPGSARSARMEHWIEAGVLCLYVGVLLVLAALVATVALFGFLGKEAVDPLAEAVATGFVCLMWVLAEFYYKEALRLRSELTGLPALLG